MVPVETGEKIKELLEQAQLSQNKLAQELGVSRSLVGKWISGKNRPNPDHMRRIAKMLNVSPSYLAGFSESGAINPARLLEALTAAKQARSQLDDAIKALEAARADTEEIQPSSITELPQDNDLQERLDPFNLKLEDRLAHITLAHLRKRLVRAEKGDLGALLQCFPHQPDLKAQAKKRAARVAKKDKPS